MFELGACGWPGAPRPGGGRTQFAVRGNFDRLNILAEAKWIYASEAPLRGVKSASVFRNKMGHCRGIVLSYVNGGARALGQCRVNEDAAELVMWPKRMCFCLDQVPAFYYGSDTHVTIVKFATDNGPDHGHAPEEWICVLELRGLLQFGFTAGNETVIDVIEEDA